ncbi:MAG: EAL domain-containing protein [Wenzhouxiangella sp.]|nr:EAL domain-containing protein [Wenzhouxiangella sp.]
MSKGWANCKSTDLGRLPVDVCRRLLLADSESVGKALAEALQSIGESLNVSHCSLFLFDPDENRIQLAEQWCADGVSGNQPELTNTLVSTRCPWLLQKLLNGQPVMLTHLEELPEEAGEDFAALKAQDVQSLILLPMFIGDKPLGVFGVDTVEQTRRWEQRDMGLLESVRDLLAHAVLRFRAEQRATRSERRYQQFIEHSQAIVYTFDRDGRYTFVSPSITDLTGYRSDQVIGQSYTEFVHPDDIERLTPAVRSALRENRPTAPMEYRVKARDGRILWHRSIMAPIRDRKGRFDQFVANALDITDLKTQAELRELLLDLATRFINLPLDDCDASIDTALAQIGSFVDADRAYVFRYDWDTRVARNTHEWCASGIDPQIDNLQSVAIEDMRDWLAAHRAGRPALIEDVAQHPEKSLRELLASQDIKSLISVPLMHGEDCIGFVGFDSVRNHHSYSDTDIHLLKVFSEILVNLHQKNLAQRELSDLARRLGQIIDGTNAGTWEWNQQTRELVFNQRWADMLGYASLEDLPGDSMEWMQRVHPEDLVPSIHHLKKHLQGLTGHFEGELRVRHRDGHWIWLLLRGQVATRSAIGRAELVSGIALDITERKQAEERLHLAASVFNHSHEGIVITDPDGQIVEVNEAFTAITGYERSEAIGRNPSFLKSGRQDRAFYQAMWRALLRDGFWSGEVWNRRKNGEFYAENLTISVIRNAEGRTMRYLGMFFDITHLKDYQQHLEKVAHFDPLTGLPNRTLLTDRLRQALAQADQRGSEVMVAYIDIDSFKSINDQYGHTHGDECLRQVGHRLQEIVRSSDTVARLGGDEFVLIVHGRDHALDSAKLLQRVLATVSTPCPVDKAEISMTVSIGATLYPQTQPMEADQLLRQADQAMYQAKQQGRNRIHFFDAEMERAHARRMALIGELRQALDRGELLLHYQPKIDLLNDQVMGVEALIRWQHPERGLLGPSAFLPALEGNELAHAVGHWVMQQSLADLAQWQYQGLELELSFNVSAQHLLRDGFTDVLADCLDRYPGIEGSRLTIEFLETGILDDIDAGKEVTQACHRLGINIALEDFGTGFSSLSHLKHLPLKQIKIDRSFVRGMLDDPEDLAIIEGVINLARAFDLDVLAEGVETIDQATTLIKLGCCQFQGYLFARPMPAESVRDWVRNWPGTGKLQQFEPMDPALVPALFGQAELARRQALVRQRLAGESTGMQVIRSPTRFHRWLQRALDISPDHAAELLENYCAMLAEQDSIERTPAARADDQATAHARRFDELARTLSGQLQKLLDANASQGSSMA